MLSIQEQRKQQGHSHGGIVVAGERHVEGDRLLLLLGGGEEVSRRDG